MPEARMPEYMNCTACRSPCEIDALGITFNPRHEQYMFIAE
jgi:hypothetical protein